MRHREFISAWLDQNERYARARAGLITRRRCELGQPLLQPLKFLGRLDLHCNVILNPEVIE